MYYITLRRLFNPVIAKHDYSRFKAVLLAGEITVLTVCNH